MENQTKTISSAVFDALTVCCEITGTELSITARKTMCADLAQYPKEQVLKALNRCRRELTGRLTLAAILQRLDTGLPSADEAFGLLTEGWDNEDLTVVVPAIAQLAAGSGAYALYRNGDKTGARMAFRSAYERMAADTVRADWTVSAGNDRAQLTAAVMAAVKDGKLTQEAAAGHLPSEAVEERLLLERRPLSLEDKQRGARHTAALLAKLAGKIAHV